MTDPITAITGLAGAVVTTDPVASEAAKTGAALWLKVLGPPAEALGEHLKSRVESWSKDALARRVLERAANKTDTTQPGTVPPRVAAEVFEKAQWSENEFVAEYLSGVLATARSPEGDDDAGVAWTAMVGRLSSNALRLHYMVYSALRTKLLNEDTDVISEWTQKRLVFTYVDLFKRGIHSSFGGGDAWIGRLLAAAYELEREGLLENMTHGGAEHLTGYPYSAHQLPGVGDMLITATTVAGCGLYLQAHGHGQLWASEIGNPRLSFDPWPGATPSVANAIATWLHELPPAS